MSILKNSGFSLVEVLVTIVILMVGLLGLAGLQGRALTAQMESYQRSQALILVRDMGDRINANRLYAAQYVTTNVTQRGTGFNGSAVEDCAGLGGSALDLCEWHNALLGAAEKQNTANVGAMIGARGCIYQVTAPKSVVVNIIPATAGSPAITEYAPSEYVVAVAWQGFNRTVALTGTAADCGTGQYGDDANRRVVTVPISISHLGFETDAP